MVTHGVPGSVALLGGQWAALHATESRCAVQAASQDKMPSLQSACPHCLLHTHYSISESDDALLATQHSHSPALTSVG